METNNTDQQSQPNPSLPQIQSSLKPTPNQKGNFLIAVGLIFLILVIEAGAYYLGTQKSKSPKSQQSTNTPTITQGAPANYPSQSPHANALGLTTWSLANADNELYLKQTININSDKVDYPNNKARTINNVYSEDKSYGPQEITSDTSKYSWQDILKEPINDSTGSVSILVSDRLFSFKRIPNSNKFLFVVELSRSAGVSTNGPWSPYQGERDLYLYDQSKGELKKISTFPNSISKYTYPKINSFSQDGRYVFIQLFECWNCGGHVPETSLVDLQAFKTTNIGKTSYFSWRQDGNYEYKDYVVIECKELQPGEGECSQDSSTLPLKTGKI